MTQQSRKSFGHLLALIAALVAMSGINEVLVSMDAQIFEVQATPRQAADLDYDFEISDTLDEKQQEMVEGLLDREVADRIPEILPRLVYVPYVAMGVVGLLGLIGFRGWGRGLGIGTVLLSTGVLGVGLAVDQTIPMVIDQIAENALPQDLALSPEGESGPALLRIEIGSTLGLIAGLIGLVRPDRS